MKKPNTPTVLSGSKGGSVTRTADNLFSNDIVEAILAVSEGPIEGLAEGAQSFFVGDTPLENNLGETNFKEFELITRQGGELGEDIYPRMGGFGNSTSVGVELAYNVPVVRSGNATDIDYLDLRLVISRLVKETKKGTFQHTGKVKVEYKRSDQSSWTPVRSATTAGNSPINSNSKLVNGVIHFFSKIFKPNGQPAPHDFKAYAGNTQPVDTSVMWFAASANYQPRTWNGSSWVNYAPAVRSGSVWSWSGRKVTYGLTPPEAPATGNAWINTLTKNVYVWNGDAWAPSGASYTPGGLGSNYTGGNVSIEDGEISIYGKTTTPFVKEFRIPVDSHPTATYDIRVTRTSGENTTEKFFDISWESFQQLKADKMNYPGLATVQLTARASDQFSSIPDFTGVWKGRIVKVPSNYDAKTRVYTGVWDGTWKLSYTNNPAYIGFDLVDNTRYGLSAYYPVTMNKFDVYEAGKWCDEPAADGSPRFTFNGVIDQPRDAREAINYVFGIFGGRFFDDGNGYGVIRIDNESPAVAIFSPENVKDGIFSYSQTPLASRHNDVTATFINPSLNWQEDRRRVADQTNIDVYGRNASNIVAFGCTSPDEAIRRARYKVITGLTEKTMVGFTTNRMGSFLQPYDIVLIADDDHEFGLHGRMKTKASNTQITLREPIYLEAGISYRISFTDIDLNKGEYTVATSDVAPGQSGLLSAVTVTGTLPAAAVPEAVFVVHQVGTNIAPKPFRVIDLEVDEDNGDEVKITAVEVNRAKWSYIDGLTDAVENVGFYDLETSQIPLAVTNARVSSTALASGSRVIRNLDFAWDESASPFVTRYRLSMSSNGGPMTELATVSSLRYEWTDVVPANYVFQIEPVGKNGLMGHPTVFEHQMISESETLVPDISGLTMFNSGLVNPDGTYVSMLSVTWNPVTDVPVSEYQIEYKDSTSATWQSTSRNLPAFEINNPKVGATYEVGVRAVADAAIARNWSYASMQVVGDVTPPPAPTNWTGISSFDSVTLKGDVSPAPDFKAFRLYGSTAGSTTLVFLAEQSGNVFQRVISAGDSYTRYKISAVDFTGNESEKTEYITAIAITIGGAVTPAIPTGLSLQTSLVANGMSKITATWAAGALAVVNYHLTIRQGSGNKVPATAATNSYEWVVPSNQTFYVAVRAVNAFSMASNYTNEVMVVSASDTIAPAVPTALAATPGFETVWLNWTPNVEADMDHYEIFESATTTTPTLGATPTFTSTAATFVRSGLDGPAVTKHYWVRSVDTSGNKSAWSARVAATPTTIDVNITTEKLANLVDATSFASGIKPVEVVSALPAAPHVQGRMVILTTDNKLYRNTGSGWTAAVPAVDITGTLNNAQIAGLEASKITGQLSNAQISQIAAAKISGQLTNNQLADIEAAKITGQLVQAQIAAQSIDASKFTSGIKPVETVATLPAAPHIAGRMVYLTSDKKLYRNTGTGWTAEVAAGDIDARGLNILDVGGNVVFGADGTVGVSASIKVNGNNVLLSQVAANSLVPSLRFVGEYPSPPNEGQLGTQWQQNAVYKNSTNGKSFVLTGTPLAWVEYLSDGQQFTLQIESSNGTAFKVGQSRSTLLTARVFKNGAEVTEDTPASWFRWRRVSIFPQPSPQDDATWNSQYSQGYKAVSIDIDQVSSRATFFCDLVSPT